MSAINIYVVVIFIRFLYSGMLIIQKAALNGGMNASVFVFYRQAFATVFLLPIALIIERKRAPPLPFTIGLKMFILALVGITATLNMYTTALDYTSATVTSATANSMPVVTFIVAAVLGKETIKLNRISGVAKIFGVFLCAAGIATIALFKGPPLRSLSHHHLLYHDGTNVGDHSSKRWILGICMMTISNVTWSLWLILQGPLLKVYPSKLLFTSLQCLFGTVQSFFVALAVERDFSRWKLSFDTSLLAMAYSGVIVTGISYYLQSWCIEKRGPVFLSMTMPLSLILTLIGSALILGELIHLGSVLGGVLLVGGLYSVLWGKSKEKIECNTALAQEGKVSLEIRK